MIWTENMQPLPMLIGMLIQITHLVLVVGGRKLSEWVYWPLAWLVTAGFYSVDVIAEGKDWDYLVVGIVSTLIVSPFFWVINWWVLPMGREAWHMQRKGRS